MRILRNFHRAALKKNNNNYWRFRLFSSLDWHETGGLGAPILLLKNSMNPTKFRKVTRNIILRGATLKLALIKCLILVLYIVLVVINLYRRDGFRKKISSIEIYTFEIICML